MNKASIHQSPEEKLAASSQSGVSVMQETASKLDELKSEMHVLQHIASDKSTDAANTSQIVKGLQDNKQALGEVKSAALITNQELKKISKKTQPEVQKVEIVEILGAKLVTIKGDKGDNPTSKELLALIRPLIPKPIKGEKGDSPTAEQILKLIKPLIPKVENGKSPTREDLLSLITPLIPKPIKGDPGKPGTPGTNAPIETPDQVIEKINKAKRGINPARVSGLLAIISTVDQIGKNPQGLIQNVGGGLPTVFLSNGVRINDYVTEINFSTNITPVYAGNGRITLTATGGGGTTYQETPSGVIDSANVTYTTTNTITTVLNFAIDGQYLHPTSDYTFTGTTITMVAALDAFLSGKPFTITYQ